MNRYLGMAVTGCLVLVVGLCFCVAAAEQPPQANDQAARIGALQKRRVEALQEVVKICTLQWKHRAVPIETLASAQNDLIEAQLDAADKPEQRVPLLAEQLKVAEEVKAHVDSGYKSGFKYTTTDVLRAESQCLRIKIKLLQEQSKLQPAKK